MSQLEGCVDPQAIGDETESYRFFCDNPETIRVLIVRAAGREPAAVAGRLFDISLSGTKLLLDYNVSTGEQVTLQIVASDFELSIPMVVRWAQLVRNMKWKVGGEFIPKLDIACLAQLAEAGDLERRRSPRRDAHAFATASWELGQVTHAVLVKNISPGGFSVVCPWPPTDSSLLNIFLENKECRISGQVCWKRKLLRGYLVGCSFVQDEDYFVLRDFLTRLEAEGSSCEQGLVYQQIGTAALKEKQWTTAGQYLQLALEHQFSLLGDALTSSVIVASLAHVWKASNASNIARAVAQTLEIEVSDGALMLRKALKNDPFKIYSEDSTSV